jgi:hypothetical protein
MTAIHDATFSLNLPILIPFGQVLVQREANMSLISFIGLLRPKQQGKALHTSTLSHSEILSRVQSNCTKLDCNFTKHISRHYYYYY